MTLSRRRGFTLVEMMVAIVVLSILTIGMVKVFRAQHQAQLTQNRGVERTMNSRAALDMIARELRNAGYDPRGVAGAGFVTTDASDVEWTADLNGDGDLDDAEESVRYYLDADAGTIVRSAGGVAGIVSDNIQGLTFTYLKSDLTAAADGDEVRHVNIALDYETPQGVMVGALETQVAIRNRIFQVCSALPTVLIEGNFEISGNPYLLGCGKSLHVNQDLKISGTVTAAGSVSAVGSVDLSGAINDEDGNDIEASESAASLSIPAYQNPTSSHCDDADYTLTSQGKVVVASSGAEYDATSTEKFGWKRSSSSPVVWEYSSGNENPGTFCVEGSAKLSGNPGEGDASPTSMTIIAKGSIEVSGNPYLTSDDPSGYLFLAGGDLKLNGNAMGSKTNFDGTLYAYSQCEVSGDPKLASQLMCKDMPTPGHALDLVSQNKISGDLHITSDCTGDC